MIFEKLSLKFDIEKLKHHLENVVLPKPIIQQSPTFGGWSVLSGNGDYRDGWQKGFLAFKDDVSSEIKEAVRANSPANFTQYVHPTEICIGYLKQVIESIVDQHLSPYRARITCLCSQSSTSWHSDGKKDEYVVRLHIPLVTNPKCLFETREESHHLPADGSAYLVYVNREHRVVNFGDTDRYHLMMNVVDSRQISKFHRVEDFGQS